MGGGSAEADFDAALQGEAISRYLSARKREARQVFLRRYWYGDSIQEIAASFHFTQAKVKSMLHRTRQGCGHFSGRRGFPYDKGRLVPGHRLGGGPAGPGGGDAEGRLRLWPRAAALAACLALIATAALTLPRQADNTADASAVDSKLDGSEYSTKRRPAG